MANYSDIKGSGGGVTAYANFAALPTTGNSDGALAFTQDTDALYVWDGTEWDRIAAGSDESPVITTEPPTAAQELNSSGATSTVTMVAEDPEGFDIEYGIKYNTPGGTLPSQLASATTINQSTGVYTFTPSTNSANEGSFKARLTASDGNRVTTRTVDFSLGFFPTSGLLGYYDFGDSNSYSGSGTTLSDLSGNNNHQTITGSTGTYLSDDGGTFKFEYGTNMNFESGGISKSAVKEIMVFAMLKVGSGGDWDNSFGSQWCPFGVHSGVGVWYMSSGSTSTTLDRGNMTAHSGETAFYAVNGNTVSTQGDGWAPFAANPTKFSSLTVSGYSMNLTNALVYNNYAIDWKGRHYVKMFAFWNRTLSAAERQQAHNYYAGLIGTNAVAWQA